MIGKDTKKVALFLHKEVAEALEEIVAELNKTSKKKVTKSTFIQNLLLNWIEITYQQAKDIEEAKEENLDA